MKGIVFSEFIELVEEVFSPQIADEIITESDLASEGAYTSVLTYDHHELIAMVSKLSEKTNIPVPELVKTFGQHLAKRFAEQYPQFFENVNTTFDFLDSIENHIHVEVKKLYSDAQVPSFQTERPGPDSMKMIYSSERPFADLAEGLILGTSEYYGESLSIRRQDWQEGKMNFAKFELTIQG